MKKIISLALLATICTSCSVAMAARKDGVSINRVQSCCTRGQLLACGVMIISSERMTSGELVEVYQIQKERGSAARALMHGALDVGTCGLWEVVGTPIEACTDQREYYAIRVYYDQYERIQKIELL